MKRGKIKTKSITFNQLKHCCRISHGKLETKHWSIKNTDADSSVNGITSELIEGIIERATNCHNLK